jgi:hypothetical protein
MPARGGRRTVDAVTAYIKPFVCAVAVALGLIAIGAPASSAQGAGFTLNLSAPSTPVVGKPLILQATGTIPVDNLEFLYWFSLDAIPTSVTTTCPADAFEGAQFASVPGGKIVVLTQREAPDANGNFSIPVAITPSAPGSLLLCAYTDDGLTNTLAVASLLLDIQPASSTPVRSRRATIPEDARTGVRGCRALLANPRSCIRREIRRASSRCRRLPTRGRRAACLRAVHRIGRRSAA